MSLPLWFVAVFLLGLLAGKVVNYCVQRLPYERSLLWPGPRCVKCGQRSPWTGLLPVVGYFLSGGKCSGCGEKEKIRELIVELLTGALFVALFALTSGLLFDQQPQPPDRPRWSHAPGTGPNLVFFSHYALLLFFLLMASLCDLAEMEIPFSLTLLGTFVGLVMATLFPYPYPHADLRWPNNLLGPYPTSALYPWPVWKPESLPAWLPLGSPLMGLLTGLAGAAAGTAVLRAIGFLFKMGRGIEGMGVGDADLMMMAGAFLGWQVVVMAFFMAVLPGLLFAVVNLIVRRTQALPFGPSLAVGVVLTVVLWPKLGPLVAFMFFDEGFLLLVFGGGAVALFVLALLLWVFRWMIGGDDEGGDSGQGPERRPPVQVPTASAEPPTPSEGITK